MAREGDLRYRILGPLELLDPDGRPCQLGGRREQIVLGSLLLEANRVVSRDRLIEALWGDEPPETAANALQGHISKVRKLLGTAHGTESPLRTRSPGYELGTNPDQLDVAVFERLATEPALEDPAEVRSERLGEALGLWRGPVLDGLEAETFARAEVTRLEELRLSVLERRIDADLTLGRHRELAGELEGLVHTHPLRETLRGQLMVALYRAGRQADALAVYRDTRQFLAEELGIDPSPALQALEVAVLNHSNELDLPERPAGERRQAVRDGVDGSVTIPLPDHLAVQPSVELVGRTGELESIADAYKEVANGAGRSVLLVAGEAGVGKTTLVAEAARRAFDQGACVLFGRSEEDLASPYRFFAEALGHYALHAHREQLPALVDRYGSELSRLLPALASGASELPASKATDPDSERFLLFDAVAELLAEVSRQRPVVLVLDDLQWADKGSLLMLRHIVAAEKIRRVLIVATYRDSELMHTDALRDTLGALRRHSSVRRIDLAGLDDDEVVSYFEAMSGQTLDRDGVDLAHAVYRETDGNPFFVGEVLRHLAETGAIYRDVEGRWVANETLWVTPLPDSVREVIGGRVVRLGKKAEQVLSLAAVIGRDFDLDLLAQASEESDDELLDLLDGAAAAALVRELPGEPGRFQFTHALIARTLYEGLGATRRARAHRQVAEALEDLAASRPKERVAELARHWVAAIQPIDLGKAIEYSRQAGDLALEALAPADAVRYYSQALELSAQSPTSDPLLELDVTIGLGAAMRQAGDPAFRETLIRAARRASELGETDRLIAAALANDRGTFSTVSAIDEEKVSILKMALGELPGDDVRRALLLSTLCSELTVGSTLEHRRSLAEEALDIAERGGDPAIVVRVINHTLLPLAVPQLVDTSTVRSIDALALAEAVGDPLLLCSAASGRRFVAASTGDIEEMDRCFGIKQELVERLDLPFLNWVHTLQRATRAVIAGDPDEAEQLALQALQLGNDAGQPDAPTAFGMQLIMVHIVRGTVETLVPLIEQAVADNPGLPVFAAVQALAHADAGQIEEARALLERFARGDLRQPLDLTWFTAMVAWAEAASACDDPSFAEPLLEQIAPFSEQWLYSDVAASGPVGRSVADLLVVLGRYDEAESHVIRAAASSEKADARFFSAQAYVSWGRMLARRRAAGDEERARELLSQALQWSASSGYAGVERRATAVLEQL